MQQDEFETRDQLETEIQNRVDKDLNKIKFERKRKDLDRGLEKLLARCDELEAKYGIEDYRTINMLNLWTMCNQLKEMIDFMTDMQIAMDYIFDTVEFMDTFLDMNNQALDSSLKNNNGLFSRLKSKIKMRKAQRNITNKMNEVFTRISSSTKLAANMTDNMARVIQRFNEQTSRNTQKRMKEEEKRAKRAAKKGDTNYVRPDLSQAMAALNERRKAKGENPVDTSGSSGGTNPSGSTSSSGSSDVSDIL